MRLVAFIRAVMVGREGLHRQRILDIFDQAGARDPVSHLATGNVSFDLDPTDVDVLAGTVGEAMSQVVGRDIEVFIRSLDKLTTVDAAAIYAIAPFEPLQRLVTYFHEPPDFGSTEIPGLIQKGRTAVLAIDGRDVYSAARELDGQIGAPGGVLEKLTGQRVTTRGWSTIQKIIDKNS